MGTGRVWLLKSRASFSLVQPGIPTNTGRNRAFFHPNSLEPSYKTTREVFTVNSGTRKMAMVGSCCGLEAEPSPLLQFPSWLVIESPHFLILFQGHPSWWPPFPLVGRGSTD